MQSFRTLGLQAEEHVRFTEHLHALVREANRVPGSQGARVAMRQAVLADDGLKAAAHARLQEIGTIRDRCHIARLQEAALKEVLGV